MSETPHRSPLVTPKVLVPVATIAANVLSYAMFLVAARLLDRAVYGETLALLNIVLIATIPSFAIQTVAARRSATSTVSPRLVSVTLLVGIAGMAIIATGAPLIVDFMRLDSYVGVLAAAACVPSLAILGLAQGATQGRQHWNLLCLALVLMGVGRVAGGIAGLAWARSSSGALMGTAAGLLLAAVVAWPIAMRSLTESPYDRTQSTRQAFGEIVHAAHAHGVFLLLSSLDLILARNLLTADETGLYAAGNVIFRAALWLPQPVALMLFAALSERRTHRASVRRGLAIIGGLVALTVLGTFVLGDLAAAVVGGAKFEDLADEAWIFAVAGGALALIQFCIFAGLAVLRRRRLALVWACVAGEVLIAVILGRGTSPLALISSVAVLVSVAAGAACIAALMTKPDPSGGSGDDTAADLSAYAPDVRAAVAPRAMQQHSTDDQSTGTKTTDPL